MKGYLHIIIAFILILLTGYCSEVLEEMELLPEENLYEAEDGFGVIPKNINSILAESDGVIDVDSDGDGIPDEVEEGTRYTPVFWEGTNKVFFAEGFPSSFRVVAADGICAALTYDGRLLTKTIGGPINEYPCEDAVGMAAARRVIEVRYSDGSVQGFRRDGTNVLEGARLYLNAVGISGNGDHFLVRKSNGKLACLIEDDANVLKLHESAFTSIGQGTNVLKVAAGDGLDLAYLSNKRLRRGSAVAGWIADLGVVGNVQILASSSNRVVAAITSGTTANAHYLSSDTDRVFSKKQLTKVATLCGGRNGCPVMAMTSAGEVWSFPFNATKWSVSFTNASLKASSKRVWTKNAIAFVNANNKPEIARGNAQFPMINSWKWSTFDLCPHNTTCGVGLVASMTDPQNTDTDGDDVDDAAEFVCGLDATVASIDDFLFYYGAEDDYDGDGISNYDEITIGTNPKNADSDGDGMPDGWEVANNLNPLINDATDDADSDGLPNLQECLRGTNPQNADSDRDGMPDGWEVAHNLNPLEDDANEDADADGLTNVQEYAVGTNPQNEDTDEDGIPDKWEVDNALNPLADDAADDADSDGLSNLHEFQLGLDPNNPDCEADGLLDGEEISLGTSPLSVDTDQDGLGDFAETIEVFTNLFRSVSGQWLEQTSQTSPLFADTDFDGLNDFYELSTLYTNGVVITHTNPQLADTDGDGINDADETFCIWTNTYKDITGANITFTWQSNPILADTDGDGLSDGEELQLGTNGQAVDTDEDGLSDFDEINLWQSNPLSADTDGDGMPDAWEIANGLDPLINDALNDADNDGLVNIEEYFTRTDPQNADTDSDGLPDGWEVLYGLNPLFDDANEDLDGDWISNIDEWLFATNPTKKDNSSDELPTWSTSWLLENVWNNIDTDGDGVLDILEWLLGTDEKDFNLPSQRRHGLLVCSPQEVEDAQ